MKNIEIMDVETCTWSETRTKEKIIEVEYEVEKSETFVVLKMPRTMLKAFSCARQYRDIQCRQFAEQLGQTLRESEIL